MKAVLDASVVVGWFTDQAHAEHAIPWLRALVRAPRDIAAPDLLVFEVLGAFARLGAKQPAGWASRAYARFLALPLHVVPTTPTLAARALELSRELRVAGWDAVYLAHAESIGAPWLTADRKILRRLGRDRRVAALATTRP